MRLLLSCVARPAFALLEIFVTVQSLLVAVFILHSPVVNGRPAMGH